MDRAKLDIEAIPPPGSRLVKAGMHEQAMQPRLESIDVAQSREVAPGANERFLDGVPGQVRIVQDQSCGGVEPGNRRGRQRGEGVVIASSSLLDQFPLHAPAPVSSGAASAAACTW